MAASLTRLTVHHAFSHDGFIHVGVVDFRFRQRERECVFHPTLEHHLLAVKEMKKWLLLICCEHLDTEFYLAGCGC